MNISELDHLRQHPMISFKEEIVLDKTFVIVSYMIADSEMWKLPNSLEARGITFLKETGECVCRPFKKFFNYGEREEMAGNQLFPEFIFEKRDGSMITPVIIDGQVFLKTKKSFYSDVAQLAQKMMSKEVETFCKYVVSDLGMTPIFEFTHPQNRIVVDYSNESYNFTLIGLRNIKTGQTYADFHKVVSSFIGNIPLPEMFDKSWNQILDDVESKKGMEGYVLYLSNGEMVKIKTKWYMSLHHCMTDLRERDIAQAVVDETIDDIKDLITNSGESLDKIHQIEERVLSELNTLAVEVLEQVNSAKNLSFKDAALKFNGSPYFGLIMSSLRGKEPNYKEYWLRNYLKQKYTLSVVYNPNFSKV